MKDLHLISIALHQGLQGFRLLLHFGLEFLSLTLALAHFTMQGLLQVLDQSVFGIALLPELLYHLREVFLCLGFGLALELDGFLDELRL